MPSVSNPMQQAVFRGCVECIRMLVETPPFYSVDACCGTDGVSPIHIAAREGHIQTLRFLSSAGACLQRTDLNGCTALHHAASAGQLRAARWLLRHGAKILLDKSGRSAIQVAADYDHMEIVNVLAKHATTSIPSSVNFSTSNTESVEEHSEYRTSRRSSAQTSDKDTISDFTTGSVDDYSFNTESSQNRQNLPHKPFSHLHVEGESPAKPSPGDCASSSGNSSLSASAPSLSPSSSSAVSCGCSTSDETTLVKSVTDISDTFTLEDYQTSDSYETSDSTAASLVTSPSPFYLHPPHKEVLSPVTSPHIDFGNGGPEAGKGILKKSNHKRQNSTVGLLSNSPFFLHPPENLVSETQKVVVGKMAPAPVNSSHSHHHHFADPCNESTPKLKVGLAESSASSSTSSPPQTPPGTKSGMSNTISECISKFQTENCKRDSPNGININKVHNSGSDVKLKNQINTGNVSIPPPPPPPPPMPSGIRTDPPKASCPLPNLPKELERNGETAQEAEPENDYEDIDEITNGKIHYEQTRKLLRSVSAPPPSNESNNTAGIGGSEEKNSEERCQIIPHKPPINCGKVPFIPPHFPTPPQDALIKPSEYLRSIQNKSKSNGPLGGIRHQQHSSRVDETMKALGVPILSDNHTGLMSPVPEETNAEDEFEEINPERMITGFVKMNGYLNGSSNEAIDENNNGNSSTPSATTIMKGGCGGIIKAEELMKVNLRKTPMSRTKSAPPLGRVIPDEQIVLDTSPQLNTPQSHSQQDNGHEPLKRTNTMSPTCNGGALQADSSAVSKADVIAELAQSSQVGGVREWKEELKRRQKEQDKAVQKEIEQFYQPLNFVSEVPAQDVQGVPIPDWKRQMMARKVAERAKKEAEEKLRLEIEAKRLSSIPMWRRQLLQRRESDAKYAQ